ncbi:MAG: CvpA family protein [Bacteroidia bacterium]|nr:CvpA family protein [Bacteroidia bacterium]
MDNTLVLNPLDLILAGVIIFGMYRGATKGFLPMSNRVMTILISIIAALNLRYLAQSLYLDYLNVQMEAQVIALLSFVTAFVIVYIVVSSILGMLTNGLSKMNIKIDNALGAIFGGMVATLGLSIALILLGNFSFPTTENKSGSVLYQPVRNFSGYALNIGQDALKKANMQINRIGIGQPQGTPEPTIEQLPANKPGVVR